MEAVLLAARALVITYNSADVIENCLGALSKVAPALPVTVIDNASADSTVERVQRTAVTIITNSDNLGFAGAVNQGFRTSTESILMILNPDVVVTSGVTHLFEACHRTGLAAGLLTNSEGRPQEGFSIRALPTPWMLAFELLGVNRLWRSNPVNRRYRQLDRDLSIPGPVEQPAGAFLAVRRDVWETLGGWDESFYPVWFEDVDFCARAREAGFQISYVPSVRAMHLGGHSVGQISTSRRARLWYGSLLRYAAKHFSSLGYRGVCLAAMCSAVPKMITGCWTERNLNPITTYKDLLLQAGGRLFSARPV